MISVRKVAVSAPLLRDFGSKTKRADRSATCRPTRDTSIAVLLDAAALSTQRRGVAAGNRAPLGLCTFAALLCFALNTTSAQTYPTKPIRLVLPFPAGGGADILARLIAPKVSASLGQQLVIDNRGGAGGNIGMDFVAKATPDGYTLLMGSAPLTINGSLYQQLPFDPQKDFAAVTLLSKTPNIVVINPSLPVRSIKDLIALAKAKPGVISYASGGSGTTLHLSAELLKSSAKIDMLHVAYKGVGPAVTAVISGEAAMMIPPALAVLPQVQAGRLRALAITSLERSPALPDLPTVAESGIPGFEAIQWYGILAPAGTPDQVLTTLDREFVRVMQSPDVKSRLAREASIAVGSSPQALSVHIKDEIVKWAAVIKASGARID